MGADVVGEPVLKLDYSATGVSLAADGRTHLFAQLVDKQRSLVVNNQATPIPIELDGQSHELTIPLERIASIGTSAGYELELIPQTTMYDAQRATGVVQVDSAQIEIPLAAPVEPATAPGPQASPPKAKHKKKKKKKKKKKRKKKRR